MPTKPDSSLQQELHKAAGWGIAVGTLLAILGIVAIAVPLATAIAIGLLFGWLFILGGIIQMGYAFLTRSSGAFIWKLLLGVLYLLGGISVLFAPGIAALTLSLILAISIVVQSLIQVVTALQIRPEQGWGWVLFSGVTGLILGGLIWAQGPAGAVWLLGVWFGLNLLSDGIGLAMASCLIRAKLKQQDHLDAPEAA